MRRSLAGIATAVTCLVAVAFLVPLTLLVGDVVRDRAVTEAFRAAAAIGPVLAVTTDPDDVARVLPAPVGGPGEGSTTAVHLPATAGSELGRLVGTAAAPREVVVTAIRTGRAETAQLPDGMAVLQPVALSGGRVALIEVDVPDGVLHRGVTRARVLLGGLALVLVAGSVLLADRLAARVVRAAERLSAASGRLGAGDLDVRVSPDGPAELREAAQAFNVMADQVGSLLAAERELAADLSHRLRTPLAGLVLTGRSLGPGPVGDQVRALTARLQEEVDAIIRDARAGRHQTAAAGAAPTAGCDAVPVLRDRLDFWGALAEDQGRHWELVEPPGPVPVPVGAADLTAVLDALLGNVFLHTAEGCPVGVTLERRPDGARVAVRDGGPGIADPDQAIRRGASGGGSSGLGLDIAGRVAAGCGGRLTIGRSGWGGAEVALELWPAPTETNGTPRRRRKRA